MGGTDIAVSCCSDDGSAMRRFGATDNSDCRQASTFQDAFAMCDQEGYRLCTLEEMLQRTTKGTGCNHDVRYNWVSTPCGAGIGHCQMMISIPCNPLSLEMRLQPQERTLPNLVPILRGAGIAVWSTTVERVRSSNAGEITNTGSWDMVIKRIEETEQCQWLI